MTRLTTDQLRDLADTAFVTFNTTRRLGLKRDQQIEEAVRAFEVVLGYREPVKAPENA